MRPTPETVSAAVAAVASFRPCDEDEAGALREIVAVARSDAPFDRTRPAHLTGSAFVLHPSSGRVLLRFHDRFRRWMQVGGHGEAGEDDPYAVARREAVEETGLIDLAPLNGDPARSLVQIAYVEVPASDDEPAHHHGDLRYALVTSMPDAIRAERVEAPLRWCTIPVARALCRGDAGLLTGIERCGALLARTVG